MTIRSRARRGACLSLLALGACADAVTPGNAAPDRILFLSHADADAAGGIPLAKQNDIFQVNADGTGLVKVTTQSADYMSLDLSPDGRNVAFQTTMGAPAQASVINQIWVMNTDGTALRRLTDPAAGGVAPRWSPDGRMIAFQRTVSGTSHVHVMNADGSSVRNVSLPALAGGESGCDTPTRIFLIGWIPDGRIAFSRHSCGLGYRYFTVRADGGGFAQTELNLGEAFWSPDGSRVAFTRIENGLQRVFVMNADGSGARMLSDQGTHQYLPDTRLAYTHSTYTPWSPDGTRLMFFAGTDNVLAVGGADCASGSRPYVVNADGTGARRLQESCGVFSGWSRSGDRLAFVSYVNGVRDVFVMNADGTGLANLTNTAVPESSALWIARR